LTVYSEKIMVFAAALPFEAGFFAKMLSPVQTIVTKSHFSLSTGNSHGKRVFLMTTGYGGARATMAHRFLHSRFSVDRVVTFGLAGALATHIRTGDIIIPASVGLAEGGPDDDLSLDPISQPVGFDGNIYCGGLALQSVRPLDAAGKIAHAGRGAVCVDMESHVAAAIAKKHGAACSVIRAVSDELDTPLELANPRGDAGFMAAARLAARRNAEYLDAMLAAGEANNT